MARNGIRIRAIYTLVSFTGVAILALPVQAAQNSEPTEPLSLEGLEATPCVPNPCPGSTLGFFSPKVALDDVRFLTLIDGHYCVELPQSEMLQRLLFLQVDEPEDSWRATGRIPEQHQEFIFRHVTDGPDSTFAVLDPETLSLTWMDAESIVYCPYDNAPGILLSLRKPPDDTPVPAGVDDDMRPLALAFAMEKRELVQPKQMLPVESVSAETRRSASRFLSRRAKATLEELFPVYLSYPKTSGLLAIARVEEDKVLFLLYPDGQRLTSARIVVKRAGQIRGGILYEEGEIDHCRAMTDSELFILPDLDGNGANEVFLRSTESYLLSIEPSTEYGRSGGKNIEYILREVSSLCYEGPG